MSRETVEQATEPAPSLPGAPSLPSPPPARKSGPFALVSFLFRNGMITPRYGLLVLRLLWRRFLTAPGYRMQLDGMLFLGGRVKIQIRKGACARFGRWAWIGDGTKIRCHEGEVRIGAKTVLGQECTISAYRQISIGEQCIVADRVMLIDFDHNVAEVERPIRVQGIYKSDVHVGSNVWIGYGAQILCGVSVGDNAIIAAGAVVTRDVPANAVVAGVPARVIRMREQPRQLRWSEPLEPSSD